MVFIKDEGGYFKAPLDKVWKLVQLHSTELTKIHKGVKNPITETLSETSEITTWDDENGGKIKARLEVFAPIGLAIEFLEGPFAGSKFFNYYTPRGDTTGITVVGEFKSPSMSDEELKEAVTAFLEQGFNEDNAYLEKI
ncbi:MAG: hypothetical protein IH932_00265 [Thaumarchaeota archaeon]|nr:hypothetical protein [Nitrososphaerota archaeon]